jgi:TetR/AcrR family transcriptional regulator, cholesterol catabolism regulator
LTLRGRFAKIRPFMGNRGEPSTRHYDEKLQSILKTSAKIFAEKGFHRTSVRDISRATGMSLAGLYYYFRTKEELLYLIQEQCFITLLQRWEKAVSTENDVRARLRIFATSLPPTLKKWLTENDVHMRIRVFAENHLSFFLHNMNEMKVMAHEDESLTGEFQAKMLVLKRRYVNVLTDLIVELQDLEGDKKVDLRVATFAFFGMMNWIYTWYRPKRDLPLAELIEQMLRIYIFGILNGGKVEEPWLTRPSEAGEETFSLWQNLP